VIDGNKQEGRGCPLWGAAVIFCKNEGMSDYGNRIEE